MKHLQLFEVYVTKATQKALYNKPKNVKYKIESDSGVELNVGKILKTKSSVESALKWVNITLKKDGESSTYYKWLSYDNIYVIDIKTDKKAGIIYNNNRNGFSVAWGDVWIEEYTKKNINKD